MQNTKFNHKEAEKKWSHSAKTSRDKHVYDHSSSEIHWQAVWQKENTYSPDLKSAKKPYYNLMMFPYPSAEGLHVGNMYAFTGADVYGRYQRMNGYDVLEPIGLDGFGIHSENYAIKVGRHPKDHAVISQKNFYDQLHKIGDAYDWNRTLETYDPAYYKWTQWLFVKMFRAGLSYKDSAMVNWCPSCKTVLADEQVIEGGCERCGTVVGRREMSSWFFRITKYADRLLNNIETIKWPERIKIAQRQWIGRSDGMRIKFLISNFQFPNKNKILNTKYNIQNTIPVWTKFWETVFGTTFLVVAPEYAEINLLKFVPKSYAKDVNAYIKLSLSKSEQERKEKSEKSGVFSGIYAINPVNGRKVPVYIADYVLAGVGTGAVMGVPAHDARDFDFAKKYNLEIIQVVSYENPEINSKVANHEISFEGGGKLINSGDFEGMDAWGEGKEKMADWMIKEGFSNWETNYHLRDWLISRQRYWGPPIPMIFCKSCADIKGPTLEAKNAGWFPVSENDLPVLLPDVADFTPKGDGTSPLHNAPDSWKYVPCPKCGKMAVRELDVSDTFLDSSWYFLAYPNLGTKEWKGTASPLNPEITKKWLPVNAYIGGAEHAVLHLLYARFVTMFLKDQGYVEFEEPFPFLFGHGLIIKDGAKMSKSKGNIVNPDEYIEKYGSDTLRTYLMFLGPYDQGGDFRDTGIEGMGRFLSRVYRLFDGYKAQKDAKLNSETRAIMHKTINSVSSDLSNFKYNTAIAKIMEYVNYLTEKKSKDSEALETLVKLLAPFAPHMTEELYQKYFRRQTSDVGGRFQSVHTSQWPQYISKYIKEDRVTVVVQVNGKVRSQLTVNHKLSTIKEEVLNLARIDSKVLPWIDGKKIINEVFVPGKLVNFVV